MNTTKSNGLESTWDEGWGMSSRVWGNIPWSLSPPPPPQIMPLNRTLEISSNYIVWVSEPTILVACSHLIMCWQSSSNYIVWVSEPTILVACSHLIMCWQSSSNYIVWVCEPTVLVACSHLIMCWQSSSNYIVWVSEPTILVACSHLIMCWQSSSNYIVWVSEPTILVACSHLIMCWQSSMNPAKLYQAKDNMCCPAHHVQWCRGQDLHQVRTARILKFLPHLTWLGQARWATTKFVHS